MILNLFKKNPTENDQDVVHNPLRKFQEAEKKFINTSTENPQEKEITVVSLKNEEIEKTRPRPKSNTIKEINTIKTEIKSKVEVIRAQENEIKAIEKKIVQLNNEYKVCQLDLETSGKIFQKNQETIANLNLNLKKFQDSVIRSKTQSIELNRIETIRAQENEINTIEKKIVQMNNVHNVCKLDLETSEKTFKQNQETIANLNLNLKKLQDSVGETKIQLSELYIELIEQKKVFNSQKTIYISYQKQLQDFSAQEKILNNEIRMQKLQNAEAVNRITKFEMRLEEANSYLKRKSYESECLQVELFNQSKKEKELEVQIQKYSQENSHTEAQIQQLKKQIQNFTDAIFPFDEKIEALEKTLEIKKKERDENALSCQRVETKVGEKQIYVERLTKRVDELKTQETNFLIKEKSLLSMHDNLTQTVRELESRLKESETTVPMLSQEIIIKEQALKERNESIARLKKKINILTQEINMLEAEDAELDEAIHVQVFVEKTKSERISALENKKKKLISDTQMKKSAKKTVSDLPM